MNNIVSFTNLRETRAIAQPSADLYFPVTEAPVQAVIPATEYADAQVFEDPSRKAIVRPDTGEVLGVHKSSYKLVPNSEIFPQFEDALRRSTLDLNGMKATDHQAYAGGRCFRVYEFPEHQVTVKRGDNVAMCLKVQNSYDGSCSLQWNVGGLRFACANGMVLMDDFLKAYGKHTRNLDIAKVVKEVNNALHIYLHQAEQWQGWINAPVTEAQVRHILQQMPGHNDVLENKLFGYFQDEAQDQGATVWSLYNAMTFWSTHEDVRASSEGNRASIVVDRERKVRSVMNNPAFLAAAA